ncbi:MAG: hypothetical protein GF313_16625 [Caldithrix sp.]|nr:hypothetical protein [Caldithrix sp.]
MKSPINFKNVVIWFVLAVSLVGAARSMAGDKQILYPMRKAFKIEHGQKWKQGFMDRQGRIIIEPQFSKVKPFTDGVARVAEAGEWGFIDQNGHYLVKPVYSWTADFSEGLAQVMIRKEAGEQTDLKTAFIDKSGEVVIDAKFDFNSRKEGYFRNGLAPVAQDGQWGFINPQGIFVIPKQFSDAHNFSEGLAPVQKNGKWGYIDVQGQVIIDFTFERVAAFSEGLAAVVLNGKWGFISKKGEVVIDPAFDYRYYGTPAFSQGVANVMQGDQWGFINKKGAFKIEPQFELAAGFNDDLAKVIQDGQCGFINQTGTMVIAPQYITAEDFYHGLAFVMVTQNPDRYAYIDTNGQVVWQSD